MSQFPWDSDVWQPSPRTVKRTSRGQVWTVRVAVEPAEAANDLWAALARELREDDGVLLEGGASIRRAASDLLDVTSGGEDVLDSLSWTLNQTLPEAARACGSAATLTVVTEGRSLGEDDGERPRGSATTR